MSEDPRPSATQAPASFTRALLAFLALPGTLAYLIPILSAPTRPERRLWQWSGVPLVSVGTFLLLWCVREFYVAGRGTLAPWSPPRYLVVSGPYRLSRNPMYLAIASVLLGWSAWFASPGLFLYALIVIIAFHLRVVTYEEPTLAGSFGEEWIGYRERVRRWL